MDESHQHEEEYQHHGKDHQHVMGGHQHDSSHEVIADVGDSSIGDSSSTTSVAEVADTNSTRSSTRSEIPIQIKNTVPRQNRIGYGRCIHPMAAELGMSHQEYMWVEGATLSREEMDLALELWDLEPPNLVLNFFGAKCPELLSPEMMQHPFLQPKIEDFLRARAACKDFAGISNHSGTSSFAPAEKLLLSAVGPSPNSPESEQLLATMRKKLEANLIQVFTTLLAACEQTNSWIIMKRDDIEMPDYYLQEALRRCPHRPVIIAMVDRRRFSDKNPGALAALASVQEIHKGQGKILQNLPVTHVDVEMPLQHGKFFQDWPPPYASHYIFSESFEPYPDKEFGPKGNIYLSGGSGTADRIQASLNEFEPCIMLLHTGRASDFYATAASVLQNEKPPTTITEMLDKMNKMYPFWTRGDALYNFCSVDEAIERASSVLECYQKDPDRFESSIVALNAWTVDPYTVLSRVSACFSRQAHASSLDGGSQEPAEETIMVAWNMHETLSASSDFYFRRINILKATSTSLAVLTTTCAVCLTYIDTNRQTGWVQEFLNSPYERASEIIMIILPALGSLASQFLNRFHYTAMWGTMYTTRQQIESHIYRYRTRTGIYAPKAARKPKKQIGSNQDGPESSSKKTHQPRDIFSKAVSELYSVMICFSMRDTSLVRVQNNEWVMSRLLEENTGQKKPLMQDLESGGGTSYGTWSPDMYSQLGGEAYLKARFIPTLEEFQAQAPLLAGRLHAYEAAILVFTLISTVLATLNLRLWIPIPVAIAGGLASFMQFEGLQSRIAALNASIGDLTNFMTYWASLTIMEKRADSVKNAMVDLVERELLRNAGAYINGSGAVEPVKEGEGEEEDGGDSDGTAAKGLKKSGGQKSNKIKI